MTNERVLAKNTILNLAGQILPLLAAVIAIPVVIRGMGDARFGLLSLVWALIGYFAIFDLGLSRALIKRVSAAIAEKNYQAANRFIWTATGAQAALGLAAGIIFAILSPRLAEDVLNTPAHLLSEAKYTLLLTSALGPLILLMNSTRALLETIQRFDLVNAVRAPLLTSIYLAPLLSLVMGQGLVGTLVIIIASQLIAVSVQCWLVRRSFREVLGSPQFSVPELKSLVSFGGWITISSIIGPCLLYSDRFLIGSMLSLAAVTQFTAPFEMLTRMWILPASMAAVLFPMISTLYAQGRGTETLDIALRSLKYVFLLSAPVALTGAVIAPELLALWIGPHVAEETITVFRILLIGSLAGLLAPIAGSLLQGSGRPDLIAKLYVAELVPSVVLTWLLIFHMGVVGAALAFAIRTVLETIVLLYLAFRSMAHTDGKLGSRLLLLFRSCGPVAAFGAPVALTVKSATIGSTGTALVLAWVCFTILAWRVALDHSERIQVKSAVRRWRRKVGDDADPIHLS